MRPRGTVARIVGAFRFLLFGPDGTLAAEQTQFVDEDTGEDVASLDMIHTLSPDRRSRLGWNRPSPAPGAGQQVILRTGYTRDGTGGRLNRGADLLLRRGEGTIITAMAKLRAHRSLSEISFFHHPQVVALIRDDDTAGAGLGFSVADDPFGTAWNGLEFIGTRSPPGVDATLRARSAVLAGGALNASQTTSIVPRSYVDARYPVALSTSVSSSGGTTTGTTELLLSGSLTIPSATFDRTVVPSLVANVGATVAGDIFILRVRQTNVVGTVLAQGQLRVETSGFLSGVTTTPAVALAAGSSLTLVATIQRGAGTGEASVGGAALARQLTALVFPA